MILTKKATVTVPMTRIENARLLGKAAIGNMFENLPSHYGMYIRAISCETPTLYNPNGQEIAASLIQQVHQATSERNYTRRDLLTIPWETRRGRSKEVPVNSSRLAASIIAFTDVQGKRPIEEFFPVEHIQTFLAGVESQALEQQKPLTIPDQFGVAMRIVDGNTVAAAILAHSAYRAIARGKEKKIPGLEFPLEKVINVARSTADIHTTNAPDRDPLGETYHWWASFLAGLDFTLAREDHPIQSRVYTAAFYHEAALTTFFRKWLLHKTNITNHHKDVDRQGLQAGITVGNFLNTN